jgi:hypothetical protein
MRWTAASGTPVIREEAADNFRGQQLSIPLSSNKSKKRVAFFFK